MGMHTAGSADPTVLPTRNTRYRPIPFNNQCLYSIQIYTFRELHNEHSERHAAVRDETRWIIDELMPAENPAHYAAMKKAQARLMNLIPEEDRERATGFFIDLEMAWGCRCVDIQDAAFCLGFRVATDAGAVLFMDGDTGRQGVSVWLMRRRQMSFDELLAQFLTTLRAGNRSPKTLDWYERMIVAYQRWLVNNDSGDWLKASTIETFLWRPGSRGAEQGDGARAFVRFGGFKWLTKRHLAALNIPNPMLDVEAPQTAHKLPRQAKAAHVRALFSLCSTRRLKSGWNGYGCATGRSWPSLYIPACAKVKWPTC